MTGARVVPLLPAASLLLLLVVGIAARPSPQSPPAREDPAAELMARAQALRQKLRSLPGEERPEARAAVVAAYRAVYQRFPGRLDLAPEAAFRAGELLRASGASADARREFQRVQGLSPTGSFAGRAGLELAHLDRREGRLRDALAAYMLVAGAAHAPPQQRDEALLWAGRMHAQSGHPKEARAVWERVARDAEDPLDRVRAHDHLAQQLVEAGDLEGAAGALARARAQLAGVALEETERGARVASALARMRSLELLKEAVARRREGVWISR